MVRRQCSLFILILLLRTSDLPGPAQMVCFSLLEEPSLIHYSDVDDSNLFIRSTAPPLCSSESGPVELDTCRVCVKGEQFIVECNLRRSSADVIFEGGGKALSKSRIKRGEHQSKGAAVTAAVGEDSVLPCFSSSPVEVSVVEWTLADREADVLVYRDGRILEDTQDPQFTDRAQLLHPQLQGGNLSVVLKNVTHEDSGTYRCAIFTVDRQETSQFIRLTVTEPGAAITAAVGEDSVLPCFSSSPVEVSVVEWTLADREADVLVYRDGRILEDTQDPQFTNRAQLLHPQLQGGNLSVVLKNVTHEDSGMYRCAIFTVDRQETSQFIRLTVTEPDDKTRTKEDNGDDQGSRGSTLGWALGVPVFILFVIAIGLVYCKRSQIPRLRHRNPATAVSLQLEEPLNT